MERSEAPLDEELYRSSDLEDDMFIPSTSKNKSWLNDPRLADWIVELNESEVQCKYCKHEVTPKLSSLLDHGQSSEHTEAASNWKYSNEKSLEFYEVNKYSSSSSTEEETSLFVTSKTKYVQKFRKSWLRDPRISDWIIESNDKVHCKYCRRGIKCKLSSLLRHGETNKHITAASNWKSNDGNIMDSDHEEANSCTNTEEDLSLTGTSKRKYNRKFRDTWFSDPRLADWIVKLHDKGVQCKYCNREIKCQISSLLRHAETNKHIRAASNCKTNDEEALDFHEEELYDSSSTEEDLSLTSTTKKIYEQKFRNSWLSDSRLADWIVESNDKGVRCKYCRREIKCKLSSLLRHGKTNKHIRAASAWRSNDEEISTKEEVYDCSSKDDDLWLNTMTTGKYNQTYGRSGVRDPRLAEWVIEINDESVKCKYCNCVINSKLYNLLKHRRTSKHVAAVSAIKKDNQSTGEIHENSMASLNPDLSKPTCRVCLQNTDTEMSSIFDVDADFNNIHIYEKMEQCAGIKVLRHEKMPTLICADCYGFLKVSYKFRTICRNSNEYLKEILVSLTENENIKISPKKNPIAISENHLQKEEMPLQHSTKLTGRSSEQSTTVKHENVSRPTSPENYEEYIHEDFNDDGDEIWFDIDYHEEDDISCGENFEVSIEKSASEFKQDVKDPNTTKKAINEKKKRIAKEKRSSTIPSKTLDISSDGAAIIREKKPRVKREKQEMQPHICEICGNLYKRRYSLELHMRRHRDEKPYDCEICGYAFHSNFELIRHMRKHTGSRPYKCSYCPRAFGDQSTLIKHERIHRNERPFKCETCGKSFTYSNVLKYHKYVHTGEKPYSCELCGKSFTRPHHLRAHLETLQHQNDPRSKIQLQNIRKNNEDDTIKYNS